MPISPPGFDSQKLVERDRCFQSKDLITRSVVLSGAPIGGAGAFTVLTFQADQNYVIRRVALSLSAVPALGASNHNSELFVRIQPNNIIAGIAVGNSRVGAGTDATFSSVSEIFDFGNDVIYFPKGNTLNVIVQNVGISFLANYGGFAIVYISPTYA